MNSPAMLTFTVVSSTSATAWPASAPSPSIARMRWRSVTAAGFSERNGRDLIDEAGEDGQRQHHVRGEPARTGEQPEGGVVPHARPPARTVRPVGGDEHVGASTVAAEERRLGEHLGGRGGVGDDGDPRRGALGRGPAGRGVDQVVQLLAVPRRQRRRSRPEVAIPPRVSSSVSSSVTPTGQAPPRTARSPPALTRHGRRRRGARRRGRRRSPCRCRRGRGGCRGSSSIVEPVDADAAAAAVQARAEPAAAPRPARRRTCGRSPLRRQRRGRWGRTARRSPRGRRARARRRARDRGSRLASPAVAVEPRQLGVVAEARHHLLEPLELRLGPVERAFCALAGLRVEQELDVGAHRLERPPQHHDVLVIVSGGRLTTRTAGAAAARPALDCDAASERLLRRPAPWRPRSAPDAPSGRCGRRPSGGRRPAGRASRRRAAAAPAARGRRAAGRASAVAHGFAATAAQLTKKTTTAIDDGVEAMARVSHRPRPPRTRRRRLVLDPRARLRRRAMRRRRRPAAGGGRRRVRWALERGAAATCRGRCACRTRDGRSGGRLLRQRLAAATPRSGRAARPLGDLVVAWRGACVAERRRVARDAKTPATAARATARETMRARVRFMGGPPCRDVPPKVGPARQAAGQAKVRTSPGFGDGAHRGGACALRSGHAPARRRGRRLDRGAARRGPPRARGST